MTSKAPLLYEEKVECLTQAIQTELTQTGWQGQKDGAGQALVQLFGHLAQVVIHRLNQVPRQHFQAFLNEAGVDRLPPRAATTELIFTPAPDSPPVIHVPQGTQVATRPSETQPEVIFETARDVTVVPAALAHCIAVDPLNYSDRTLEANGQKADVFSAFQGEVERERILYIGHDALFTFGDEFSRQNASFTLQFALEPPKTPDNDQWSLQLLYWNGEKWADVLEAGAAVTGDLQLRGDGKVTLGRLPMLTPTKIGDVESIWIACKLTGGTGRRYLPVLRGIWLGREIACPPNQSLPVVANAAFAGIQSGTVFVPLDLKGPVSPFGMQPTVLDAFYLQIDEAFTKPGATVRLSLDIEGVPTEPEDPSEFNQLRVQWEYFSSEGWTALGASVRGCPALARLFFEEKEFGKPVLRTHPITRRKYLEFEIPKEYYDRKLPAAFKDGTVVSDIYTGGKYVTMPVPDTCASLPPEVLLGGGSTAVQSNFVDTTCALSTSGFVQFDVPAEATVTVGASPDLGSILVDGRGTTLYVYDRNAAEKTTRGDECAFLHPPLLVATGKQPTFGAGVSAKLGVTERSDGTYQVTANGMALYYWYKDVTAGDTKGQGIERVWRVLAPDGSVIRATLDVAAAVEVTPDVRDAPPPSFAQTEINGQVGYWVRARIVAGSYDVPQKASAGLLGQMRLTARPWLPPVSYPPLIKTLQVAYRNYASKVPPQPVTLCQSKTDMRMRDHLPDLAECTPFRPYTTAVEAPALYLGFTPLSRATETPAFPGGQWIELRFRVQEQESEATRVRSDIIWEYWNSYRWTTLRAKDGTLGLQRTGYLGFYAPPDHCRSEEFGQWAYWMRARPTTDMASPNLRMISLNTVEALNAETIGDELLGSSNGEPAQRFVLARPPVLPDVQVEVREPIERTDIVSEKTVPESRASGIATVTEPAATPTPSANEVWMLWQPVATFHACQPNSRCYMFDPITGEIYFGDGERGRIPPPGRDNIHAKHYRTHQAAAGNVAQDTVTVLRNPKGDLGQIRSVTNLTAAAGGSAPEEVVEAEERGPYSLKSRQRAITLEDFAWLAREVDGVARAQCLPMRDAQGLLRPGWVTLVITPQPTHALPESAETKPIPTPALLRQVHEHLQEHALANFAAFDQVATAELRATQQPDEDQIAVKGPTYLEVTVAAKVVASTPEQSDAIRFNVVQRLNEFLHPLKGGPERTGWEPGRDVYVSEIAAEIEQVPGVDHIEHINLLGTSRLQQWLTLRTTRLLTWEMPAGSQVSSFDEQIKLALAEPIAKGEAPTQIVVYAFNVGNEVNITAAGRSSTPTQQRRVAQVAEGGFAVLFDKPFEFATAAQFEAWQKSDLALTSSDQRTRLPVQAHLTSSDKTGLIQLLGVIAPISIDRVSAGEIVNIVAESTPALVSCRWREARLTDSGFKLIFDKSIDFDNAKQFESWRESPPALLSDDQRIRLPIRPLYKRCRDGKVRVLGLTVQITVNALNAGGGVSIVAAGGGALGAAPLQGRRQVAQLSNRDFALLFDQPQTFADGETFAAWQDAAPALLSDAQHIRLPIQRCDLQGARGEIHLLGVALRSFVRRDQISLTHHDRRTRRVDLWPIRRVTTGTNSDRIFVPADSLVCSGNHLIEVSLEAEHVHSTAISG